MHSSNRKPTGKIILVFSLIFVWVFSGVLPFKVERAQAAVSFVNSASNSSSPNAGTSVNVSGIGIQANDLIIVAAAVGDTANNGLAAPTEGGYARVQGTSATLYSNDTADVNLDIYYKIADGTETAVSFGAVGGTNAANAAVVMVFRGVDTSNPFQQDATTATGIDTSAANPPSQNWTGSSGAWTVIVGATGHTGATAATFTFPTGYTTNAAQKTHDDNGTDVLVGMGYKTSHPNPEDPGAFSAANIGTAANNAWAAATIALNPLPPVTTLGTGTDPSNYTTAPSSTIADAGAFTFQTSEGTDSITSMTIRLSSTTVGVLNSISQVRITSDNGATTYFSASGAPSTSTLSFSGGTPIPVNTTPTQFKIRITPTSHDLAGRPGSEEYYNPYVQSWSGSSGNTQAGSDTNNSVITLDNLSPDPPTTWSLTAGDTQVAANWTTSTSTDFYRSLVVRWSTSTMSGNPTEGVNYATSSSVGAGTVACNIISASSTAVSCLDTGVSNGTTYWYKLYSQDSNGNYDYSGGAAGKYMGSATPAAATVTIGSGTDSSSTTIAPGNGIIDAGSFTLQTSNGTDSITSTTVVLAGSGTPYDGLSEVRITSNDGSTTYFSAASNPSSNTLTFSGGTPIPANTSQTQFKIRVTPKTHANMDVPPGAEYNLSPYISAFTSSKSQLGSDSNSNTLKVDNLSPASATSTSGTAGDTQVTLNWTTSTSTDYSRTVILRWTGAAGSDVPVEGTDYATSTTIGSATVACSMSSAASSTAVNCVDTGLSNGTSYSYKIFQKDSYGNYDTGIAPIGSPFTPVAPPISFSGSCKQSDGTTNCADGTTVAIAFGNSLQGQTGSVSSGSWTISNLTAPASGTVATIFADGVAANLRANAVTKYISGSPTNVPLIQKNLIVGSPANQTITNANISSYDNSVSGDADIIFEVDASNNLTLDPAGVVTGDTLLIRSGNTYEPDFSGAKIISAENLTASTTSVFTASGTIMRIVNDFKNYGTFNQGQSTLEFSGNPATLVCSGCTFYNLTSSSTASTTISSSIVVSNNLTIDGYIVTSNNIEARGNIALNGTLSGAGNLVIFPTSSGPGTTGNLSTSVYYSTSEGNIASSTFDARTYNSVVYIWNSGASNRTAVMGSGTFNFNGGLAVRADSTGSVILEATTTNPIINISSGNLQFTGGGAGSKIIQSGSGTWTINSSANLTGGTYTASPNNTLKMIFGTGTLTTAGNILNNLEINSSGNVVLAANATTTISGNLLLAGSGTPVFTSTTILMTGTTNTITGGGKTINNLTIDPSSTGTITISTSDLTLNGNLNVASGDTLSIDSGRTISVSGDLALNGTISGAGTLGYKSGNQFPSTGTISSLLRFDATNNDQSTASRTFGGAVEVYNNSASNRTLTLAQGSHAFSSHLTLNAAGNGNITLDSSTNNATTTITGSVDFTGTGGGTEIINGGNKPWTISGNLDISAGTFSAPSVVTLGGNYINTGGVFTHNSGLMILNGSSSQVLVGTMDGSSAFNSITINNNSGSDPDSSPSISFIASTTAQTLTAQTSSTKIKFQASNTFSFDNIYFNGQSTSTRVTLRSSVSSSPWYLNVSPSGTKSVSNTDVKDSDASLGDEIPAADGTNLNSGGNSNWAFVVIGPNTSSTDNDVFEIDGVATVVKDINIQSGGGSPGGRITSSSDIRVIIPGTFNAIWDSSVTSISCVAGVCSNISTSSVTYSGGDKIAIINVIQNFVNGEFVRISGLKMKSFSAVNAAANVNRLRVDGAADAIDDATDTKTKTIKGKATTTDHALSQPGNKFDISSTYLTDGDIFRFKIIPVGENISISQIILRLDNIYGLQSDSISSAKLYLDVDADGEVDVGEPQILANGTTTISSANGNILFGGTWTATTTSNIILRVNMNSLDEGDSLGIYMQSGDMSASGETSLQTISVSYLVTSRKHGRPIRPRGGGGGGVVDGAPPATGNQGGGGPGGGSTGEGGSPGGGNQGGGGSGGGGGEAP